MATIKVKYFKILVLLHCYHEPRSELFRTVKKGSVPQSGVAGMNTGGLSTMDFVHPLLNDQIPAIGGHYMIAKEGKMRFKGRDVLYLVGYGVLDNSCCGSGGCGYAIVPGYIVAWHTGKTQDQERDISSVAPLEEDAYREVGKLLRKKENVTQVHFHTATGKTKVLNFF